MSLLLGNWLFGMNSRGKNVRKKHTIFVCTHVWVLLPPLLRNLLEECNSHLAVVLNTMLARERCLLQYLAKDGRQLWMLQL